MQTTHFRAQRWQVRQAQLAVGATLATEAVMRRAIGAHRDHREEEGYFLPLDEVVRRAVEAWDMGATEVCIQAGLPPKLDGSYYVDLCRAIKAAVPEMHLHAFSPEEVLYGSTRADLSIPEFLKTLRAAGLGTLPGTSAEILDQEVRDRIARGRITVDQWIEVITSAHALGIRTTSTIMYGHVEQPTHWIRHMDLLRRIQKDTGGFLMAYPFVAGLAGYVMERGRKTFANASKSFMSAPSSCLPSMPPLN